MKKLINIDNWERKEHYLFFSKFEEPFFGVTVDIDCTIAYQNAKIKGNSFFKYYLYRILKVANEIENFKYRIIDNQVYFFDQINVSPTINRPNNTFGFAYIDFNENEQVFNLEVDKEIKRVQNTNDLIPAISGENVIHFSVIPWVDFTSLSHARCFSFKDSSPKISFGKIKNNGDKYTMPLSIHVHHALMDGYHIGLFIDKFQELMNE